MNLAAAIIISMVFTGITVYQLVRNKILSIILIPVVSILYGMILFFVAVGLGMVVFALAALPAILAVIIIIRNSKKKK